MFSEFFLFAPLSSAPRIAEKISNGSVSRSREAFNKDRRDPGVLDHQEPCGGGELIDGRHGGDFQRTSNPVAPAAYIQNRIDSRGADCEIDQSFAPRPTEGIADDDPELSMAAGNERRVEFS